MDMTCLRKWISMASDVAMALVFAAVMTMAGATDAAAQFSNPKQPTVSPVPQEFVGTWKWNMPRQSCGSTVDSYGNKPVVGDGQPETFARLGGNSNLCQWPIDQLEKVMNGRGRLWQKDFSSDDAISPRWTCVAAGLGTNLTESYLRTFIKRDRCPRDVVGTVRTRTLHLH